jgi:hypothetical protein
MAIAWQAAMQAGFLGFVTCHICLVLCGCLFACYQRSQSARLVDEYADSCLNLPSVVSQAAAACKQEVAVQLLTVNQYTPASSSSVHTAGAK